MWEGAIRTGELDDEELLTSVPKLDPGGVVTKVSYSVSSTYAIRHLMSQGGVSPKTEICTCEDDGSV